jgi:DUF177 domain-containing protein
MDTYIVDTADLGSDRIELRGVFPPGVIDLGEDVHQSGDVRWSGSVAREDGRIRFGGTINGVLEVACDRCLEPARVEVSGEFDLFFEQRDSLEYEENAEIELDEPDMRTAFMTGTQLNVAEVIGEQLQLAIPMKPLCRDECRGLCPECGQNLNNVTCDCTVPAVHLPFGVLRTLKDQMEERN